MVILAFPLPAHPAPLPAAPGALPAVRIDDAELLALATATGVARDVPASARHPLGVGLAVGVSAAGFVLALALAPAVAVVAVLVLLAAIGGAVAVGDGSTGGAR